MSPLYRLLFLSLLFSAPAFGMCVSTSYEPVAWSKDGQAVLIHETARGPEGGGSSSYLLIDFRKEKSHTFAVSSNFSPGDATEPETISEQACRDALAKGNEHLERLGFEARFKSDPNTCKEHRDDVLSGKERKDYSIELETATVMATKIGIPSRGETPSAFSKNGRNSIVIEGSNTCDARCYRARKGDKPETYKNDGSCE
jgi:hypothetical protein